MKLHGADTSTRRFMPPLPPAPWSDVRDALSYGPSAPQTSRATDKPNEDCLFLNVWTPALHDGRKRPVMFYIHGGAYNNGSGYNRFLIVTDLGLDKLFLYRFESSRGKLSANDPPFAALQPGAGPRHVVFHPGRRFLYVVNEIQSTITAFAYNAAAGALKELQTVASLPKDFLAASSAAEIRVHPNGKFLYSLNRGHDSVALFAIEPNTGKLTMVELMPTEGKTAS